MNGRREKRAEGGRGERRPGGRAGRSGYAGEKETTGRKEGNEVGEREWEERGREGKGGGGQGGSRDQGRKEGLCLEQGEGVVGIHPQLYFWPAV